MATIKNISDSYTINVPLMTVNGNLIVTGNTASINSTNSYVTDNIITLNNGLGPSTAPTTNAGIEVDRGSSANVQIRWNETTDTWQITNDGSGFGNILSAGTPLAGNLDISSFTLYSSTTHQVKFDDNVAIQNTSVAPTAVAGYNIVYAQTPSGGGSGLYVTNTTLAAQELATQAAAIKYAIIFG